MIRHDSRGESPRLLGEPQGTQVPFAVATGRFAWDLRVSRTFASFRSISASCIVDPHNSPLRCRLFERSLLGGRCVSTNATINHNMTALLAVVCFIITGCANLDERTVATKAPIKKTPEAMMAASKRKRNSFVDRVKNVLPKKASRQQIADDIVSDDDPTRLDSKTKKLGPELFIAAARLSEKSGRYDVALEQYGLALKADGSNRNALIGLARLQHRGGKVAEAIRIYRDALNIYRNDAVIMNDLGLCYVRNNQLGEAISTLHAATQAAPDREMYLNNLAAALVEAGRAGEAVAHLSRLHGPAAANYKVGYLLDRAGRKAQAGEYLQQALTLNPNMEQARTLLASVTPRVSSVPHNPVQGPYEIPPSQAPAVHLQTPRSSLAPKGEVSPATPAEALPHLQKPTHRFGPFGFVPKPTTSEIQLVTFAEECIAEHAPVK